MRDPLFRVETRQDEGPREPSFRISTEQLAVLIGFVSIGVLFIATLVAYVITRIQVDFWRPEGTGGLPAGLLGSTLLLAGVSSSLQWAYASIRKNRQEALKRGLWLGAAFALAFLVGQAFNWLHIARQEFAYPRPTLFAFTFYMLTGVHALHVLGGFVPLGIVLYKAWQREYSSSRCEGVKLCIQYWHYLGVIWLILLTTMYVAS